MARTQVQFRFPRAQRGVIGILIALVALYVVEMVALRSGGLWVRELFLTPAQVAEGHVWQLFTSLWFHSPVDVSHLLFNGLMLYWFGTAMESWWGTRRFLIAYVVYGLAGAVLTCLVAYGLLGLGWPGAYGAVTLGASGAITGVTTAWCIVHWNQDVQLLLLPPLTGKHFFFLLALVEFLTALSYAQVSVTSHVGGMAGAFVLAKGLWRPSQWKQWLRRRKLHRQRSRIEQELRVLEGGKRDDDPKMWN